MNNPKHTRPLSRCLKPTAHRRAIPLLILVATFVIGVTTAVAVHDVAVFELDGDVTAGSTASGFPPPGAPLPDWDQVCQEGTAAATTPLCTGVLGSSGASTVLFVTDASGGSSAEDDQPVTGGTHHVNDLNLWDCKIAGISPVKNDITHAFAATYNVDGNVFLYFGLDRIDAGTGDAAVGFWFYRGTHTCTPVSEGGTGQFTGLHSVGDLLVVSEFTNGGGVSTIKVYNWVGDNNGDSNSTTPPAPGTGDGAIQLLAEGADCRAADGTYILFGDDACATVNKVGTNYSKQGNTITPGTVEGNIVPPWPYANNDGGPAYALGAFFEGGVNATALGLDLGCGGTFIADTQASQSLTSQIHDFATGTLSLCDLTVTKTGDTLSKVGDDVSYTITIENTGAVTLYKQSIIDDVLGDLTDGTNPDIVSSDCGDSLAAGASCTITLTRTVLEGDPDPLENTVTVIYDSQNDLLGDEVTRTDSHSVNLFQPSITLDKTGDKTTASVGDTVNYTVTITNTSSSDTPTLIPDSIVDNFVGDLMDGSNTAIDSSTCGGTAPLPAPLALAPSASCTIHYHRTVLGADPDPLVNTATAHYHPDGFPNDITASDDHSVDVIHPATTLTLFSQTPPNPVYAGTQVTIVVRETNTGDDTLTNVNVTGTGCTPYSPASVASLAPGASADFTCSFSPTVDTAWTADGHGTDSLGNPAPAANEHVEGSVDVIRPATTLTLFSQTPPNPVTPGTLVTIVVRETNTGDDTLTNVNVTDTGCTPYSPASVASLAPGAFADFTCSFSPAVDTAWTADGHGTDSLGNPAPAANEHVEGIVTIQEVEFAGCTPGFFKNHYSEDVWGVYYSNPTVGSVFASAFGAPANATLLEALSFSGGSGLIGAEQNLLRAAVAALLNTQYQSSPLPYPLTTSEVISMVNAALASGNRTTMNNLQSLLNGYNNLEGPKC